MTQGISYQVLQLFQEHPNKVYYKVYTFSEEF